MERSTVLDCTASCHLAQGGRVGGQLAAYFLLSLAVPSCNRSNRINESAEIRTRNRSTANRTTLNSQPSPQLGDSWWIFGVFIPRFDVHLAFSWRNSVPKVILSHPGSFETKTSL